MPIVRGICCWHGGAIDGMTPPAHPAVRSSRDPTQREYVSDHLSGRTRNFLGIRESPPDALEILVLGRAASRASRSKSLKLHIENLSSRRCLSSLSPL
jgi:hypothetical protein